MRSLERLSTWVNRVLAAVAGLALATMMLFAVADMVLRSYGHTVAGSYEIIGWLSAAAMALALGSVQQHRGHVAIDLLATRLSPRVRAATELLMRLLALALFAAVTGYLVAYGRVLQDTGSLSETLRAIVYPWVYAVAAGAGGLALALLVDLIHAFRQFVQLPRQSV
jgi:TRAP-type C4-dicarboxylate transport system permease small subunit